MGVDPLGLFVRQAGNGSMKFLLGNFPLVKLTRRKRNEKSLMLDTIIPVKGIVGFVAVSPQTVSCFFAVKLLHFADRNSVQLMLASIESRPANAKIISNCPKLMFDRFMIENSI